MNKKFSVCGCDCSKCGYLKQSKCSGCSENRGKVWWTGYLNTDVCPIFACVINEKKFDNCGSCSEIPCKLWRDIKDPNRTEEQHEAGIKERVESLRKQ